MPVGTNVFIPSYGTDLFEDWSMLNCVICNWRSRFDGLRDGLPKCTTLEEARNLLVREEFNKRYPLLPEYLK